MLLVARSVHAIPTWERSYTGDGNEEALDILHAQGGCVIVGRTNSYGPGTPDADNIFLYRLDGDGNIVWSRIYGDEGGEIGVSVTATVRRGFAICGGKALNQLDDEILVIRTDELGNQLWSRTYGTPWSDGGGCILATRANQLVVAGTIGKGDYPVPNDAYALWLDLDGNVIRARSYGGPLGDFFQEGVQTADGGFLFGGSTNTGVQFDIILVRTDPAGAPLWTTTFGEADHDRCGGVYEAGDGSFYVAGTGTDASYETDAFLAKLDAGGRVLWVRRYDATGSETGNDLVATADGGFLIAGSTEPAPGRADVWLVRTDADGGVLWTRTHTMVPPIYADVAWAAARSWDGGFFAAGFTAGTGPGTEIYVLKTDENGEIFGGDARGTGVTELRAMPQTILLGGTASSLTQLLRMEGKDAPLFDALGRLCGRAAAGRIEQDLPSGVYFLRLPASGETVRLVKAR